MDIRVSTLTEEFEEIEAVFNVFPDSGEIEAEFIDATLETHTGRKIDVTEVQLHTLGIFDELREDALGKFDFTEHEELAAAIRADQVFDLEREGILED